MARVNEVSLIGVVKSPPWIKVDDDGDCSIGQVALDVIRDVRDGRGCVATPIVMSENPSMIAEFDTWDKFELVMVKGIIATTAATNQTRCKKCGAINSIEGQLCYIKPIFARSIKKFDSYDQAYEALKTYSPISNQVAVVGDVANEPKRVRIKRSDGEIHIALTQYQIGMNRYFMDRYDSPDKMTDFPWVKSYGKQGISDHLRLHAGSQVYIDGYLQSRGAKQHATCDSCGCEYEWSAIILEIVPYRTEYLKNCRTIEEVEALEAQRKEQSYRDSMSHLDSEMGIQPATAT